MLEDETGAAKASTLSPGVARAQDSRHWPRWVGPRRLELGLEDTSGSLGTCCPLSLCSGPCRTHPPRTDQDTDLGKGNSLAGFEDVCLI